MPRRGSFRRWLARPLVVGGIAVACGGKTTSYTSGPTSPSGGTASLTGGNADTGGSTNPTGGASSGDASTGGATGPAGGVSNTGGTNLTGGAANPSGGISSGGNATGGSSSGGSATGGTRNALCDVVPSLPAMGTACSTASESQCDASGNRCICQRGIWYCNAACPATEPTPDTVCEGGAYCNYAPGVTCACINLRWMCVGTSGCPADVPTTGAACNTAAVGLLCDFPNSGLHFACICTVASDGGTPTWTCFWTAACPATQPPYGLSQTCAGPAMCTYSTPPHHCACFVQSGTGIWACF